MNYLFTFLITEGHLYPTVLHTVWGRITIKTSRKATPTTEQVGTCNNCVRNSPDVDTSSICKKRGFFVEFILIFDQINLN